jgi:hypothetical protein
VGEFTQGRWYGEDLKHCKWPNVYCCDFSE